MSSSHVFQQTRTIFILRQKKNILKKKNAPPPGSHVFQPTGTVFELVQDIIGTNLLTRFHDDRTINMSSRVLTMKNATPLGSHLLTKFHDDWTINVTSRVHVFQANVTIFELIQDIIETNLLTKFHEDWTINVICRPYTEKCPAPGGYVCLAFGTIFELFQDIIGTNLQTMKIGKYMWPLEKNAPPPSGHVFQPTGITFELVQDIIGMNLLTKCHEDRTINVASRVLTRFNYSHIRKNAPPLGSHVFQANVTIF
ncbi:hypothetical protein DPMN_011088 [Dreissena polymorpha]|uniref:Uncharacterized protein n=1 Tax=Dreissena polymorpha TaxID=45954 RepID=A0A9D4MZW9_DREPO|nr:hypothetical protein DPMN_011088 [Dreissena polymorpha]